MIKTVDARDASTGRSVTSFFRACASVHPPDDVEALLRDAGLRPVAGPFGGIDERPLNDDAIALGLGRRASVTQRPRHERIAPESAPWMSPLVRSQLRGEPPAATLLDALPRDDDAWIATIEATARRMRPWNERVARAVIERMARAGAGPRALDNARALVEGRAVAVVTGQQPGLLGGAALAAYKLAGAVKLAARLDALVPHRVVPVYWHAAEDHDVDEANRATVIHRSGS